MGLDGAAPDHECKKIRQKPPIDAKITDQSLGASWPNIRFLNSSQDDHATLFHKSFIEPKSMKFDLAFSQSW